ncbi:secretory lipase-domain-containing protein [Aspergillus germanicus]
MPALLLPDAPLLPSEDPFYIPPTGWETTKPGSILRHRVPGPLAAFGVAKVNLHSAHQILYRTTDSFGNPIATVTTILVPHNADYTKLLSYQAAPDAADPDCAPSFALQRESDAGEALSLLMPQLEYIFVSGALNKGYVVAFPDHLGPKAAFLANNLSGQAVLDNIRAALASGSFTNISPHATVALWGYSGGSLASGFAAELQPIYAPELNIVGAALGGTVPSIPSVIQATNKGPFAGLIPAGIQGLANEYPMAQELIRDTIRPDKYAAFNKTQKLCFSGNIVEYLNQDLTSYFGSQDVFDGPGAQALAAANNMGKATPKIPLFIYKSVNDEVSPVKDTDVLYSNYCGNGARVEYVRDLASEHITLAVTGGPHAFLWLIDRFNGVTVKEGCSRRTQITGLTDPKAALALGRDTIKFLLGLLSLPVGPISR